MTYFSTQGGVHPPRALVRDLVRSGCVHILGEATRDSQIHVDIAGNTFVAESFATDMEDDVLIIRACPSLSTLQWRGLAANDYAYELKEAMRNANVPVRPDFAWKGKVMRTYRDIRAALLDCNGFAEFIAFRETFRAADGIYADGLIERIARYEMPGTRDRLRAWMAHGVADNPVVSALFGGRP